MCFTDPIADLLTRIRNGHIAKHDRVDVPISKLKVEICRILDEQGFIESYQIMEGRPAGTIRVFLRYDETGSPAISRMARVSRPGRRVYRSADAIRPVLNGLGVGIVSTSLGLLTDRQAKERRVGGEMLCELW